MHPLISFPPARGLARRALVVAFGTLTFAAIFGGADCLAADATPLKPVMSEAVVASGSWSHAYAPYNATPKYPRGFDHFDFVNPMAPKGGTLQLANPDRRASFDKFNPFTVKGQSPAALTTLMFESLAVRSGDEPATIYGLLAEEMLVAPDLSSITFRIHPKARYSNGDPVSAADVKHVYEMLTGKWAAPAYRITLGGVALATVLDDRTIRFDLKERTPDTIFNVAGLPVFSRKWGQGPDGKPRQFDEIVNDYPITTGPYTIAAVDSGRRIDFARDPNYWGRELGVNRGQYNFDRVVYRYYQDNAVSFEAFKAGEFDFVVEYSARRWARLHAGTKWDDGRIVKEVLPNGFGAGLQSYLLNMRRPLFQDLRVRQAINLAYDFEAVNVYKQYKRTNSMFANSEFAATGLPTPAELALLEPFRAELPAEVFGPAWEPPRTDTGPNALRENLKKARTLLEQAGWKVDGSGVLRNAKGERFEFEYLDTGDPPGRAEAVWQRNLEKIGIRMNVRHTDFALFRRRLEKFDFDMVTIRVGDFTLPNTADLKSEYGSESADVEGSNNYRGLKSRAVDGVLAAMEKATTMDQLRDAARALDRIVMHQCWQVPDLYAGNNRVSRWDRLGIPKVIPKYYQIATPSDWMQWGVTGWWAKNAPAP